MPARVDIRLCKQGQKIGVPHLRTKRLAGRQPTADLHYGFFSFAALQEQPALVQLASGAEWKRCSIEISMSARNRVDRAKSLGLHNQLLAPLAVRRKE